MEMKAAKSFEDLIVWQKAHQFVLSVYQFTATFPHQQTYSLTSQFRQAAISVTANISEGFKKKLKRVKLRFMNISQGSIEECKYYHIPAKDLNYRNNHVLVTLLNEVSTLIEAYSVSIYKSIDSVKE